jgi:signal peptidase II
LSEAPPTRWLPPHWWLAFAVAAAVITIDQLTKVLALHHLSTLPRHVIGPFGFQLTFNSGSAFSLFQGTTLLLALLDVVLIVGLCWMALRTKSLLIQIGIGLILGGAIGNMADRVVSHHGRDVVDFITLSHWPTFNAADSAITIGAIIVVIGLLKEPSSSAGEPEAP